MTKEKTEELIEKILDLLDRSTMLGAAWDCLSATSQARFKLNLRRTINSIFTD